MILGSQWGDEGKGKLVDMLASDYSICARFNGGANAGHTVKAGGIKFAFHLLPCGILYDSCVNVLGNGVVVNLGSMFNELAQLDEANIPYNGRLLISDRAHITSKFHIEADSKSEKGNRFLGTTKQGIGPTYSAKMLRIGLRVGDLVNGSWEDFERKYKQFATDFGKLHGVEVDIGQELESFKQIRERLIKEKMVVDTVRYIHEAIDSEKRILAEGANATMLDIDFGTYPFVTSSNTTIGAVCTGLGVAPRQIESTVGVLKAYTTRVGEGPFPTECDNEIGETLRKIGGEFGATTGRPRRCGWLDLNVVKFSQRLNGFDSFNLTKLDVLDGFEKVEIATHYELDGKKVEYMPTMIEDLARMKPVMKEMPGWKGPTSDAREFGQLPQAAQDYVHEIEKQLGKPVNWVGVGPDREQMIFK